MISVGPVTSVRASTTLWSKIAKEPAMKRKKVTEETMISGFILTPSLHERSRKWAMMMEREGKIGRT